MGFIYYKGESMRFSVRCATSTDKYDLARQQHMSLITLENVLQPLLGSHRAVHVSMQPRRLACSNGSNNSHVAAPEDAVEHTQELAAELLATSSWFYAGSPRYSLIRKYLTTCSRSLVSIGFWITRPFSTFNAESIYLYQKRVKKFRL